MANYGDGGDAWWMPEPAQGYLDPDEFSAEDYTARPTTEQGYLYPDEFFEEDYTARPTTEHHVNLPTSSAGDLDILHHEYTNSSRDIFTPRGTSAMDGISAFLHHQPTGNTFEIQDASVASLFPSVVWPPLTPNDDSYYDPDPIKAAIPHEHVPDYVDDATNLEQGPVSTPNRNRASKKKKKKPRYNFIEWEKRELDIYYQYMVMRRPLPEVIKEMKANGFHATESMYKRKFKSWSWYTYDVPGRDAASTTRSRLLQQARGRQIGPHTPSLSPSTIQSSSSNSGGSSPGTIATNTPLPHIASMGMDASELLFTVMLFDVQNLYGSHIKGDKWQVKDARKIQEDEHDDFLVNVGMSLRDIGSDDASAHKMVRRAFQALNRVVGAKEGYDCGFFSLPAIWTSYLRFIRGGQFRMAKTFLSQAIDLSKRRFDKYHFLVRSLVLLQRAQDTEPHNLEEIILRVYRSCIAYVGQLLESCNITFLSLWVEFAVYLDKSAASHAEVAVQNSLREYHQAVQKSGAEDGEYDDHTLDLLGMILYVQQATPSKAKLVEMTARDMIGRIERRIAKTGEGLHGELLIKWKDLKQILGEFSHAQGDDATAVVYMNDYLDYGVREERDLYALQQQALWYGNLGNIKAAWDVHQYRLCGMEAIPGGVVIESVPIEDFENANQGGGAHFSVQDGGYTLTFPERYVEEDFDWSWNHNQVIDGWVELGMEAVHLHKPERESMV